MENVKWYKKLLKNGVILHVDKVTLESISNNMNPRYLHVKCEGNVMYAVEWNGGEE